jgi:spoIIIJ-associated protein
MLFDRKKKKIKEVAEKFFKAMDFPGGIDLEEKEKNSFYLNLKSDEPQMLIGKGGQTLSDIQYILRRIINKKNKGETNITLSSDRQDNVYIEVDVNNYRRKKKEYLKELAQEIADEVALTKEEKTLEPMSSYERRIIHVELSSRGDIETESSGQEPERRVIVRPTTQ